MARAAQQRGRGRRVRLAPVWRLMMVSEPERARSVFADGERDVVLGDAIGRGRSYLEELFGPDGDGTELA